MRVCVYVTGLVRRLITACNELECASAAMACARESLPLSRMLGVCIPTARRVGASRITHPRGLSKLRGYNRGNADSRAASQRAFSSARGLVLLLMVMDREILNFYRARWERLFGRWDQNM